MDMVHYLSKTFSRYKKDERGNIAMLFGTIFVLLIACVGTGYDMNQLVSTKQKASSIADTAALTAAVYYSTNGKLPESTGDGFMHDQEYDAESLNFQFNGMSTRNAQNVKVKVTYDLTNKEATARVYGNTKVAFMQIWGYNTLDFQSESVAKFSEVELKNPASIMLVLDNSGSMDFDDLPNTGSAVPPRANPPSAEPRIDALIRSVDNLMTSLNNIAGSQGLEKKGERFLRSGMITYAGTRDIFGLPVAPDVRPIDWGIVGGDETKVMDPDGGTNSSPPLILARGELLKEDDAHKSDKVGTKNYPGDKPVKFLIFMTDGQNNNDSSLDQWENSSGTGLWRRIVTQPGYFQNQRKCRGRGWRRRCWTVSTWVPSQDVEEFQTGQTSPAGTGWQEGLKTGNLDRLTRETCRQMREEENVQIYTVGFALREGWFETNDWGVRNYTPYEVEARVKRSAVHMLQECAGREYPERFMLVEDAAALEQAFEDIGLQIVKEVIRLKS